MSFFVVGISALIVAALTLFSGFGMGTLLMPVFAIFFPLEIAIAATAVVHLANNIFKVFLVGKSADKEVLIKFSVPAIATAIMGAFLLNYLSGINPITTYTLAEKTFTVTPIKVIIAVVIFMFALYELIPRFDKISFDRRYLSLGGAISGFFGGISGLQGAMRSAFLIKANLTKEAFIGTGVMAAVLVDTSRLMVYGVTIFSGNFKTLTGSDTGWLVLVAIITAFIGSYFGKRMVKKVTLKTIQLIVGIMLILLAVLLAAGMV